MGHKLLQIQASPEVDEAFRAFGKQATRAMNRYLEGVAASERDKALLALEAVVIAMRRALKTPDQPVN